MTKWKQPGAAAQRSTPVFASMYAPCGPSASRYVSCIAVDILCARVVHVHHVVRRHSEALRRHHDVVVVRVAAAVRSSQRRFNVPV